MRSIPRPGTLGYLDGEGGLPGVVYCTWTMTGGCWVRRWPRRSLMLAGPAASLLDRLAEAEAALAALNAGELSGPQLYG